MAHIYWDYLGQLGLSGLAGYKLFERASYVYNTEKETMRERARQRKAVRKNNLWLQGN